MVVLLLSKPMKTPGIASIPGKKTAISVVKRWLGEQRRTGQGGNGVWQPLAVSHEEILAKSGPSYVRLIMKSNIKNLGQLIATLAISILQLFVCHLLWEKTAISLRLI
jgi:hypothetical protein